MAWPTVPLICLLSSFRGHALSAGHSIGLTVFTVSAASATIWWLLFNANDFVPVFMLKGLVGETASEFQFDRSALFLLRCEVCGMDELICVRLTFGILKSFLAVSGMCR